MDEGIFTTVMETVSGCEMFTPGDDVLVGVSGGPDSVALLHILQRLSGQLDIRLTIAHLDHGLRGGDGRADARFVCELAEQSRIPIVSEFADVRKHARLHSLSLEEAGRDLRYDFFFKVAAEKRCRRIAVGHNANDNAEQVLMALLRGSGPSGMGGIPPVREGVVVRPLIRLTRQAILSYLDRHALAYRTDASNGDPRFLRNKIRLELVPLLTEAFNPNAVDHINRFASLMADESRWMDELLSPMLERVVVGRKPGRAAMSISRLNAIPTAARRRLVRRLLLEIKNDLRRIGFSHIENILELAFSENPYGSIDLPDRIRIRKNRDRLSIVREAGPLRQTPPTVYGTGMHFAYSLQGPGTVVIPETGHTIRFSRLDTGETPQWHTAGHRVAFFDMDKIQFPLVLRNVAAGDRFRPLGMSGTQKVKDFFINNKVDRALRSKIPIVVSGNRIVWIAGYRLDESVKIDRSTVHILRAEIALA